ncbi:MFS transporter [Spirilliplanes yamanashiensis]|uniref:MFS transporter n=1 Tax=Spirilliplanes yamanashiensis TaxID=42233 RepID=A0A8J3YCG6_9ACTN|nr:MFS transporter [Spirilliplanes yamanashiensis]MDP9818728.1 fucose permease [Spirilliplanes yamanashiensis]GIJ05183.1 MFS transporter [Spirilliplanes yamanashiensis]
MPSTRGSLLLLAYLGFVSLGLPDGLLGVGWPSMAESLGVPTSAVGLLLVAGTAGYLASSVAAGFTLRRLGVGALLAGSTGLACLALSGYASSGVFALTVAVAFVLGLGSGAIDSGLNAYAASAFGARHMNWMHAFFGLGVAIGPLIMTGVLLAGWSWRWGYVTVAVAQAALATAFALTARRWARTAPPPEAHDRSGGSTLRLPAVWLGALVFALYVAIEAGAGLWAFLLLTEARGLSAGAAGLCVSLYWAMLFAGRIVFGPVSERVGSRTVLLGCLVALVAGAALVAVPGVAALSVLGLAVLGFAAAPVFPLLILTTADRVGAAHADRTIGVQVGAAALGGALVPAGIGLALGGAGERAGLLGPILLALAVALLVLHLTTGRRPAPVTA